MAKVTLTQPTNKVALKPRNTPAGKQAATDDDDAVSRSGLADIDIEAEAKGEVSEALKMFRERAAQADQRFVDNTDSEFWFAVGFQNRAQKDEFLRLTGIEKLGDKYIDGVAVAKLLGIKLQTPMPEMPRFGHDKNLQRLSPRLNEPYPAKPKK